MPHTGRPFLIRHRATSLTGGSARSSCGGSTAAARRMTMRDCNAPSRRGGQIGQIAFANRWPVLVAPVPRGDNANALAPVAV